MSPRTGRPKIDNPRSTKFQVRLLPETIQKLERCADALGVTKTAVIEHGIDLVDQEIRQNEKENP